MDYKDMIAVTAVVAFVIIVSKFFPNNPVSLLGSYIKNLFTNK